MSVAEWTDTYDIHHWRILWSSYRKLAWVGFEPTTTEFHSDALTNWEIKIIPTYSVNSHSKYQFDQSSSSTNLLRNSSTPHQLGCKLWRLQATASGQCHFDNHSLHKKIYFDFNYFFKGYLRYKTIISQNVLFETQLKNFFIS